MVVSPFFMRFLLPTRIKPMAQRQRSRWTERSLALLKSPEKFDFTDLQRQLYARDYRDRLLALPKIFELKADGLALLIEALRDPHQRVRELAAKCLTVFPDRPAVQSIVAASQYRDFHCCRTIEHHTQAVTALAISPDDKTLLSVGGDGVMCLWDLASGDLLRELVEVESGISKAIFSGDGRYIFSNHASNQILIWESLTGRLVRRFAGHSQRIAAFALAPMGNNLVTASWDGTIGLWDLSTGQLIDRLTGHRSFVYTVAISPDGEWIFSGDRAGQLWGWQRQTGRPAWKLDLGKTAVQSLAVHPTLPVLFSGDGNARVSSWNLPTGEHLDTWAAWTYRATQQIVTSSDGAVVFQTCGSGISIWHQATGWFIGKLEGHRWATTAVAVSHDGQTVISGSDDKTMKVWRSSGGIPCNEHPDR